MTPLYDLFRRIRLPYKVLFVVGLLMVLVSPVTATELPLDDTPPIDTLVAEARDVTIDFVGWCPSDANVCRVNRNWSVDELETHFDDQPWSVWQEDDQLIFALRGQVADVFVSGGIATNLIPVANSPCWVATLRIRNLDHAIVSYVFGVVQNNRKFFIPQSSGIWRGKHAPPPPKLAQPLQGYLRTTGIYSPTLDEMRPISFYLPPGYEPGQSYPVLYMTDGQALEFFAPVVEPLIDKGLIPPTILIGVHSGPFEGTRNRRAEEYILGINDEAYTAHEEYFTETVRRWAELNLGASQNPSERAIMGFSSGATFAGNVGIRKPDLYGHVMMMSSPVQPSVTLRSRIDARYYLTAGTLEPPMYNTTRNFYFSLLLLYVDTRFNQRFAGHDSIMWREELARAMVWMFKE